MDHKHFFSLSYLTLSGLNKYAFLLAGLPHCLARKKKLVQEVRILIYI
jgi:hypothetical protein